MASTAAPSIPATVFSDPDAASAAASSSRHPPPKLHFTPDQLSSLNDQLSSYTPQQILEWSIDNLPGLYQTTAFGLTGCAALDMVAEISRRRGEGKHLVDVIFIDTLYHFQETLELAQRATKKVGAVMHTYTPPGASSASEFESILGPRLWETDEESYDFLVKVEPARRAYDELEARAVITGRRRSQGGERSSIPVLEVDETGLIKVNPLAAWSYAETWDYIKSHDVPYNTLVDQGYKSIGDWHSTKAPGGGGAGAKANGAAGDADERSGRWTGNSKTECGLHKDYFKMKRAFEKKKREKEMAERDSLRDQSSDATTASAPMEVDSVA